MALTPAVAAQRDRQEDQGNRDREAPRQPGEPRDQLEERQQEILRADIDRLKQQLQEFRISNEERGTPTEAQLVAYERQLYQKMNQAGLDPIVEMVGFDGFQFLDQIAPGVIVGAAPMLADGEDGDMIGQFADDGTISLNFAEPVNLAEFARFVARALGVNIFADPTLEAQTIEFMAPIDVSGDQLLDLLAALVEERGFVLEYDRLGFYKINTSGELEPVFGDDDRATSRMIRTPMVKPSQVVPLIESLFGSSIQGSVKLTALDDLGLVVASGPPRLLDNIEDAVGRFIEKQLDQEFFTFELEHVAAEFARDRLLILNGESGEATTTRSIAPVRPGSTSSPGGSRSGGGNAGSLANVGGRMVIGLGNTLVFRGQAYEADLIRAQLSTIDVVARLIAKRYTAGSVAEQAAVAASELGLGAVTYADQLGGGGGSFSSRGRTGRTNTRTGLFGSNQEPASVSGSKSVVDLDNGTVVYYGTPSQHELFSELVEQFVADAVLDELVIQVYKLDNAEVANVVSILNELIDDPRDDRAESGLFPGQRGGGGRDLDQVLQEEVGGGDFAGGAGGDGELGTGLVASPDDTIITSDEERNEIIIKAKPQAQRQFERLIKQLDTRLPQVQLDVQIVSITTSNNFEWGADLQANIGEFFSYNTFGNTTAPADPFDTPGFTVPGNGLIAGIIDSSSISLVIRALESIGDTRLVSNPSIIVNDNATASLNSVRTEPFSTVSQGGDSTVTGQGGEAEAGTTLVATPQISSGGYISLEYEITLSSFDLGGRQPGLSPPTQEESYQSNVTLPSDSTIVVGGFRQTIDSDSESRIPLLGAIPIIGNAFKTKDISRTDQRIFVFITPRILDNPRFTDMKILTEGPGAEAGIASNVPPLDSVRIPIRTGVTRLLPRNDLGQEYRGGAGSADGSDVR